MQYSVLGQQGPLHRLHSCCSSSLRRLRKHTVQTGKVASLATYGGLAASSSVVVFASNSSGSPDFGGSSNDNRQSSSSSTSSSSSSSKGRGPLDWGSPLRRCTDSLLVLNGLMFILQWASKDVLMLWGAKINSLIAAGQWWRLLTSSFLHTSAIHLLINSHALATIGPHVELLSGGQRFMTLYLTSAVLGTTASYLMTPAPSVGASSALFGLGAALAVFYYRHRDSMGKRSEVMLQQLGVTLAINMAYSLANRRIDNWGHLGGLVGGAAVSWLLGPRLIRTADGQTLDQPPLPLMAFKSNGSTSSSRSSSTRNQRGSSRPSKDVS